MITEHLFTRLLAICLSSLEKCLFKSFVFCLSSSRSWWWRGKPGVLQCMGLQRVRHNWVTELNWFLLSWRSSLYILDIYSSDIYDLYIYFSFCGQSLYFLFASSVTIERPAFLILCMTSYLTCPGGNFYHLFSPSVPKFHDNLVWHLCILLCF